MGICAAESAFVDQGHLLERLGRRGAAVAGPSAIAKDADQFLHCANPEPAIYLVHLRACGRAGMTDHHDVGVDFGQDQVGVVLDAAVPGFPVVLWQSQNRGLLLGNSQLAIRQDVEAGLDGHQPDLGTVTITDPGSFGREGRAIF